MFEFVSNSPQETWELGKSLGKLLQPGDVISLSGELGAGKTLLVKGIASGQGIDDAQVTSPTFTLIQEYRGKLELYHFDVYRLTNPEQLEDLGYEEYFYGKGVSIVEWGELISSYLPDDHLDITLEKGDNDQRRMTLRPSGTRSQTLIDKLGGN